MTAPQTNDKAQDTSKLLPLSDAVQHALAVTKRGVDELLIESEFAQKLARSEQSGKPLRIKLGLDQANRARFAFGSYRGVEQDAPTVRPPDHSDLLDRRFHFMIGDPSGRNAIAPTFVTRTNRRKRTNLFQTAGVFGTRCQQNRNSLQLNGAMHSVHAA